MQAHEKEALERLLPTGGRELCCCVVTPERMLRAHADAPLAAGAGLFFCSRAVRSTRGRARPTFSVESWSRVCRVL